MTSTEHPLLPGSSPQSWITRFLYHPRTTIDLLSTRARDIVRALAYKVKQSLWSSSPGLTGNMAMKRDVYKPLPNNPVPRPSSSDKAMSSMQPPSLRSPQSPLLMDPKQMSLKPPFVPDLSRGGPLPPELLQQIFREYLKSLPARVLCLGRHDAKYAEERPNAMISMSQDTRKAFFQVYVKYSKRVIEYFMTADTPPIYFRPEVDYIHLCRFTVAAALPRINLGMMRATGNVARDKLVAKTRFVIEKKRQPQPSRGTATEWQSMTTLYIFQGPPGEQFKFTGITVREGVRNREFVTGDLRYLCGHHGRPLYMRILTLDELTQLA